MFSIKWLTAITLSWMISSASSHRKSQSLLTEEKSSHILATEKGQMDTAGSIHNEFMKELLLMLQKEVPDKAPQDPKAEEAEKTVNLHVSNGVEKVATVVQFPLTYSDALQKEQGSIREAQNKHGQCSREKPLANYGCARPGPDAPPLCQCGGFMGFDFLKPLGLLQPCVKPIHQESQVLENYKAKPEDPKAQEDALAFFFGECKASFWQELAVVTAFSACCLISLSLLCCCCGRMCAPIKKAKKQTSSPNK